MRHDKLTTKFQDALGDAQSLALAHDAAYIQPEHLLAAMLEQEGGPAPLLQRAGVHTAPLLRAAQDAIARLPQVQGGEGVQVGPDLGRLLQET
ncbi:MAG: type VI secretion system ATPase TssH, partial [Ottowia sp.]|nr:type VI secretion system ATPase TssH [Ottowia sp.]